MKAIALVCPGCGSDLTGLPTDRLFGCDECKAAYEPTTEGLSGPYPVVAAAHDGESNTIPLPFWRYSVEAKPLPQGAASPRLVVVPAFDLRRRSYYGDPGLAWTMAGWSPETEPPRCSLHGAALRAGEAEKLARFSVLRSIDAAADITGLDIDVTLLEPSLLLVDFIDEGASLVDPVEGTRYPAIAFCDLPALRGAALLTPVKG